jgi:hypothetical protein
LAAALEPSNKKENGSARYIVYIVGQTDTHWIVRKMNPDTHFEIPKSEWPTAKAITIQPTYRRSPAIETTLSEAAE